MDSEDAFYSLNCQLAGLYMIFSRAIARISPSAALAVDRDLRALIDDPTADDLERDFYRDLADSTDLRPYSLLINLADIPATAH